MFSDFPYTEILRVWAWYLPLKHSLISHIRFIHTILISHDCAILEMVHFRLFSFSSILWGSTIWFLRVGVVKVKCRSVCVWGEGVAENPAENEFSFPRETKATSFLSGSLPCSPTLGTRSYVYSAFWVINVCKSECLGKCRRTWISGWIQLDFFFFTDSQE